MIFYAVMEEVATQQFAIVRVDAESHENVADWAYDPDRACWTLLAVLPDCPNVLSLEQFDEMAIKEDSHGYRKTDKRHGVRPAQEDTPSTQTKVPPA
jgi:hypothetical protein